jgi:hypothetical protein
MMIRVVPIAPARRVAVLAIPRFHQIRSRPQLFMYPVSFRIPSSDIGEMIGRRRRRKCGQLRSKD